MSDNQSPTFFDPDRYRVKSDSRLPLTLCTILAGIALGLVLIGKIPVSLGHLPERTIVGKHVLLTHKQLP